jgi:trehalose/maltose transport system substrate-binding protein
VVQAESPVRPLALKFSRAPHPMAKRLAAPVLLLLCVLCVVTTVSCHSSAPGNASEPVTLTFVGWGPASVTESETARAVLADFSRKTGIQVRYIAGPESMTDRLQLYLHWLEKKSPTPDVFYMDVVWPGLLADYMIDLKPSLEKEAQALWPAAVQHHTVNGRLVAMPYNVEVGVLHYRTDLLKKYGYTRPPETWDELAKMAAKIQAGERAAGNRDFWGFVWQGAPYEGLTCNALEWQSSSGGGKIIEDDATISVNNPQTIKALKMARSWIGTISPPSVLAFMETDGRNVWDSGNAAFRRDWVWRGSPGAIRSRSHVTGMYNLSLLPSGGAFSASVLGGQSLAVSKYSDHPREAIELVRYLTSRDTQLELWRHESMLPALREFYEDPTYLAQRPDLAEIRPLLTGGTISRPSTVTGRHYDEVSRAYFTAVHSVLTGDTSAEKAMANLESELVTITGFKTGKPNPPRSAAPSP